jgi:hypothetical protein
LLVSNGSNPIWSPDGRWILYESGGPASREVHVVAADGGPDRKIADGWAITWSPGSDAVVYLSHTSRVHPNLAHVYLVNADGSGRTQLFSDVVAGGRPEDPARLWSPDGTRLALAMADGGGLGPREGIVVVDRKGRVVRDLRKHDWFHYGETLSWRDERTIVFSKTYNPPSIETRLARDPGGIYALDVESGQERRIIGDKEILVDPRNPPW